MVIRFFASIRNVTKEKEIEWDQPTSTLGELLRLLSDRYGPEFRHWVLDGENLGGSIMVVINGDDARHQAGLETRLAATDVVSILPIMAGGWNTPSSQRSAISFQQEHEKTWGPKGLKPAVNGRFYVAFLG
jgi:MoaD family protein